MGRRFRFSLREYPGRSQKKTLHRPHERELCSRSYGEKLLTAGLVSIIIITRNSETTLPACLKSIQNQTYSDHEVIVVDNGSEDKTLALVHSPKARLITNLSNFGFAKANNQALEIAKGEFVLFLNSDAAIATDFLQRSVPLFGEDQHVGAIAVKILRPENGRERIIDSAGLLLENWRMLPRDRGQGEVDRGQYDHRTVVFGAPGACALYRRSALDSAALGQEIMDEDFFAYYEDVDLAWRVRRQNWITVYIPEAVACHRKRGPWGKERFIQVKAFTNRYWCYVKNVRAAECLRYAMIAIPYEVLRVSRTLALNPSWISAYFHEWRLAGRMMRKRRMMR